MYSIKHKKIKIKVQHHKNYQNLAKLLAQKIFFPRILVVVLFTCQLRWQVIEMLLFVATRKAIKKKKIENFLDKCFKREAVKSCNRIKDYMMKNESAICL